MQDPSQRLSYEFFCPYCAQSLSVTEELSGQSVGCPSCNNSITVPPATNGASQHNSPQASPPPLQTTGNQPAPQQQVRSDAPKRMGCMPKASIGCVAFVGLILFGVVISIVGVTSTTKQEKQSKREQEHRAKPVSAFDKKLEAAANGDVLAQYELGFLYSSGDGVQANEAEAIRWWRKAAESGHPPAQFTLGLCYMNGDGVPLDKSEGMRWWKKSAEQGFPAAQAKLGYCYRDGNGVPKDIVEAAKWWKLAAEQGNSDGQYNLGMCYKNGSGVVKDDVEAYKWIYLANMDESGKIPSMSLYGGDLKILSQRLTGDQIEEAKRRCAKWQEDHLDVKK